MKKIEKQQEKIANLLKLIEENPDLEIIPMVDSEIVCGDEYSNWLGSWGNARIDEYWNSDERIYFRFYDEEELIDNVICDEIDENIDDDEAERLAEEIVNSYDWVKAIIVRIETP